MARVLVAGASGALGREVVRALAGRGHEVVGLTRRAGALQGLPASEIVADAMDGDALRAAVDGVERVFSCLGAPVAPTLTPRKTYSKVDTPANGNLIRAARDAGAERFVYVGVAGSDDLAGLDYVDAHVAVEGALASSGLDYAVLRPTGFFSAFAEILPLAGKGPVPMFGDGGARSNPISDSDLAALCADAIDGAFGGVREVGGPEVLTRREIADMAREAVGQPPKVRRVPSWLARGMAWPLWLMSPRMAHILRFYVAVGEQDCVAEACGEQRLGPFLTSQAAR